MVNRAIIQLPVRHGKSVYCSHLLPCWHVLTKPDLGVWVVTYGSDFAQEFGSKNLDLVKQHGPALTGLRLHPDFQRRAHFRIAPPYAGEFRGLGIQGGLAGKGARLIICDDLIKEWTEVVSEEARDRIHQRFHGEVLNRLEPGGKIIVIMSRRHPDDLSGRLLASNAQLGPKNRWHELTFPALSDDGKALWPERYSAEELISIRESLEVNGVPWVWSGLYQQDASAAMALTEWPPAFFKDVLVDSIPNFKPKMRLMSLDPSCGKDKRPGDFAALLAGDVDKDDVLWIHDPKLLRVPLDTLEDLSIAMVREYRPHQFAIETNGFQEAVAMNIAAKCPTAPILAYCSIEKKETRIRMLLSSLLYSKRLKILSTIQGRMILSQLRDFPLASHDDGPDSLALMCQCWRDILLGVGGETGGSVPILTM